MSDDHQHEPTPSEYDSEGRDVFGRPVVTLPAVDREPGDVTSMTKERFKEREAELARIILDLRKQLEIAEALLIEDLLKAGTAENIGRKVLVMARDRKIGPLRTLEEIGALFAVGGKLGVKKTRVSNFANEVKAKTGARVVCSIPAHS